MSNVPRFACASVIPVTTSEIVVHKNLDKQGLKLEEVARLAIQSSPLLIFSLSLRFDTT